jgi:glutaredoxin
MKTAFLIFTLLILSACVEQQTAIKADSEQIVVEANTTTTVKTPPSCKDQCEKDYCLDNDLYLCNTQENGCSYVANQFKISFTCINVSAEEEHSRASYIKANISFR